MNIRRLIIWIFGFVVIFLLNILVENVLLPKLDLNNTDKNDIYFKAWWLVAGIWLVVGLPLLALIDKNKKKKSG